MNDKAMWDDGTTEVFINAMLDQIYAHERHGMSFSKEGWNAIVAAFNEKTGRGYDQKQLKNRFDIPHKDLKTWDMLLNETGLGVDSRTEVLNASTYWWREKCQVNRAYSKFCRCPLKFENELRIIFKNVYTTGDTSYCPSYRHSQNDDIVDDDVYIPTMDEQEGSGDSEDESFGAQPPSSTDVSEDLDGMGLSSQGGPSVPTDLGSQGKRKRVDQPSKRKKMKTPVVDRIADAVSVIDNVSRDRSTIIGDIRQQSIDNVIKDLISLDKVKADPDFLIRCIHLLTKDKSCRDTFASLYSDNKHYLIKWLRFDVTHDLG